MPRSEVSKATLIRPACRVALAGLLSFYFSGFALSKDVDDGDDESATPAPTLPNIYLDLRTNYATVPANALSIGFSNPSLFSALTTLRTLASLTDLPILRRVRRCQPCRRRQVRASGSMSR